MFWEGSGQTSKRANRRNSVDLNRFWKTAILEFGVIRNLLITARQKAIQTLAYMRNLMTARYSSDRQNRSERRCGYCCRQRSVIVETGIALRAEPNQSKGTVVEFMAFGDTAEIHLAFGGKQLMKEHVPDNRHVGLVQSIAETCSLSYLLAIAWH